jgi:hypothetical protein
MLTIEMRQQGGRKLPYRDRREKEKSFHFNLVIDLVARVFLQNST